VVGLIGDGSAMYTCQALWTAARYRIDCVFVILNNSSYRILKQRLHNMRGLAEQADSYVGMELIDSQIDFVGLARRSASRRSGRRPCTRRRILSPRGSRAVLAVDRRRARSRVQADVTRIRTTDRAPASGSAKVGSVTSGIRPPRSVLGPPTRVRVTHRLAEPQRVVIRSSANRQLRRGNKRRECRVLIPSAQCAPASVLDISREMDHAQPVATRLRRFPPALRSRLASMPARDIAGLCAEDGGPRQKDL
jgi:hypothetical protein